MPSAPRAVSRATARNVELNAGDLSTLFGHRMEAGHDWYRMLSAEERSWVHLVAQAGIASFVAWLRDGQAADGVTADIFATAPRELTRSISLRQTLDLVRTVVDVVEQEVTRLAEPGEEQHLREGILRYSREIAFSAAHVYAQAAEARGAWDARLESLVVDAVLRGEADESMQSRAAALGWGTTSNVAVVVGRAPSGSPADVADSVHRATRRASVEALVAVQGRRLVVILGQVTEPLETATGLGSLFGDGPIVVGPTVPHLFAAGRSARAAISGLTAVPAWPDAPGVVHADDLLAERALAGDQPARTALIDRIWRPLAQSSGGNLLHTAEAFLDSRGGLEGTARMLFVHANTVRYRLGRIADVTGYDLTEPREAHTVRIALTLGRLGRLGAPLSGRTGQ